jgi:hypothetical protein
LLRAFASVRPALGFCMIVSGFHVSWASVRPASLSSASVIRKRGRRYYALHDAHVRASLPITR